jgi:hypothetical protein
MTQPGKNIFSTERIRNNIQTRTGALSLPFFKRKVDSLAAFDLLYFTRIFEESGWLHDEFRYIGI